jgi:hypothetical protein
MLRLHDSFLSCLHRCASSNTTVALETVLFPNHKQAYEHQRSNAEGNDKYGGCCQQDRDCQHTEPFDLQTVFGASHLIAEVTLPARFFSPLSKVAIMVTS